MSTQTPEQTNSNRSNYRNPETSRSRQHLALADQAARCVHVKPNGLRCGSPALKGQPWCHFHNNYFNAPWEDTFPPLEDGNGVQAALMYTIERLRREAFRNGEVNVPVAKALLYGLQTASWNLRYTNFDPVLESAVTSDPAFFPADGGPNEVVGLKNEPSGFEATSTLPQAGAQAERRSATAPRKPPQPEPAR